MYLQNCGLLRVTNKRKIRVGDPYLVFPRRFDVNSKGARDECDAHDWSQRVFLAYYLNFHILGKSSWGERDFSAEVDSSGKWLPGKLPDLNRKIGCGTEKEPFIPLSSLRMQCIEKVEETVDTCYVNLEADIRGDPADFIWEITPNQVDANIFLIGRTIWKKLFDQEIGPAWRHYAHSQFIALKLLPSQSPQRELAGPDSVCFQYYFIWQPNF